MKKVLICLGLALALSACSTQRFDIDGRHNTIPSYEGVSHFVFWGIGQEKDYNPKEICGAKGISSIDTHHSFLDGLFNAITFGVYAPESYAIYCR